MRTGHGLLILVAVLAGGVLWWTGSRTNVDDQPLDETAQEDDGDDRGLLADVTEGATLRGGAPAIPVSASGGVGGRVLDGRSDAPIAGARVMLLRRGETLIHQTTTDEEGRFAMQGVAAGRWWIVAMHAQFMPSGLVALATSSSSEPPASLQLDVPEHGNAEDRQIRLQTGVRIAGRVVDEEGQPISGAKVLPDLRSEVREIRKRLDADLSGWREFATVLSDEEGRFSFGFLPPLLPTVRVGASKTGWVGKWSDELPTASATDLILRMVRPASIAGHVRTKEGAPLADVNLDMRRPWRLRKRWLFEVAPVRSKADGSFQLDGLPPDDVTLRATWVEPLLVEHADQDVAELTIGEVRAGVKLTLPPRYVLHVRVRTPDGEPNGNERLALLLEARPADWEMATISENRADGSAVFAAASPGPFRLVHRRLDKDVVVARDITLPSDPIEFVAGSTPVTSFTVRVLSSTGEVLSGCDTTAFSLIGDPRRLRGTFQSKDYGSGSAEPHAVKGTLPISVIVTVSQAARKKGEVREATFVLWEIPQTGVVTLQLPPPEVLVGSVRDEAGKPVLGVRIRMTTNPIYDKEEDEVTFTTDEEGNFSRSVGKFRYDHFLYVEAPAGYVLHSRRRIESYERQAHIVLRRGGRIAGRIELPAGIHAEGKTLLQVVWPSGFYASETHELSVDANGAFSLDGVPLDRPIRIEPLDRALAENGLQPFTAIADVVAGSEDIRIPLTQGVELKGAVSFFGPRPTEVLVLAWPKSGVPEDLRLTGVGEDGNFAMPALSGGPYLLQVHVQFEDGWTRLDRREHDPKDPYTLRVGTRGSIAVHCKPDSTLIARAWRRNENEAIALMGFDEVGVAHLRDLPAGERFDIVVRDESDKLAAFTPNVLVGSTVSVSMAKSVDLSGLIRTQRKIKGWAVLARSTQGNARTRLAKATFSAQPALSFEFESLVPGHYDLFLIDPLGGEELIARDLEAGAPDLSFDVR